MNEADFHKIAQKNDQMNFKNKNNFITSNEAIVTKLRKIRCKSHGLN